MLETHQLPKPTRRDRLPRSFYERETSLVARELVGKMLLRKTHQKWIGGMIVETEAYLSDGDAASHSARGKTNSNASMFCQAGTLYVYPIHSHHCLNAVTENEGQGCAVLIRAIEPIWGISEMSKHRGHNDLNRLTRGPGMLCQALDVDRADDTADLTTGESIFIAVDSMNHQHAPEIHLASSPRIGIRQATDLKLRFFARGNRHVSGPRRQHEIA